MTRLKSGSALRGTRGSSGHSGELRGIVSCTVKEARERGTAIHAFHFNGGSSGAETKIDVVIWCTGFSPAVGHLSNLGIIGDGGKVAVNENRSVDSPNLWMEGYGGWTGLASATLIGVTRTAQDVVKQVQNYLVGVA